jgi:hypothetical protein
MRKALSPKLEAIDLGDDYMQTARELAVEQATRAGYRLAALLKKYAR